MHRDSVGSEQAIRPREVNWMIAGRGITHSERFEKARRQGDGMHGIQAWVALPEASEEIPPSFSHHGPDDLPAFREAGLSGRLIAGAAFGARAGVETLSPMFYLHCDLETDARARLPDDYPERAAYVVTGAVEVAGRRYEAGRMLVFTPGAAAVLKATQPAAIMLLGGDSPEPRFIEWNFVSSSKERIEQAKADWRAGRMKLPDLDQGEPIPFPGDPAFGKRSAD